MRMNVKEKMGEFIRRGNSRLIFVYEKREFPSWEKERKSIGGVVTQPRGEV
jgi:hypothetical protein